MEEGTDDLKTVNLHQEIFSHRQKPILGKSHLFKNSSKIKILIKIMNTSYIDDDCIIIFTRYHDQFEIIKHMRTAYFRGVRLDMNNIKRYMVHYIVKRVDLKRTSAVKCNIGTHKKT